MTRPVENDPRREAELDALLAEYLRRRDAGDAIDRESFLQRHVEHADDLRELLRAEDLIDVLAGPPEPDSGATPEPEEEPTSPESSPVPDPQETLGETLTLIPGVMAELTNFTGAIAVPCVFGEYELLREIGRGGMGVVYQARQVKMDRVVAVKMIRGGHLATELDVKRFYTEAQSAGKLTHASIVGIHQVGEWEGHHFFSMDFVEGRSLADVASQGPLDGAEAARYVRAVAEAVQYAHENGVLHRDLKPANVLVDEEGRPLITDFGLAKTIGADQGLTDTGTALGTPSYMSPEQACGQTLAMGPASDVYSLGAILFELLTGRPPFRAETQIETVLQVIHDEPPPPRSLKANVDPRLANICMMCLRKDPKRRYASAQALADDLGRYLNDEPIVARPPSAVARAWYWTREIPIVAALSGRPGRRATGWHKLAQWAMLLLPVLMALAVLLWPESLPSTIRIATGSPGGQYQRFGTALSEAMADRTDAVRPLTTKGSQDNLNLLLAGKADLALMQWNFIDAGQVAIVAPLYDEAVHVLVRQGSSIQSLSDLRGKTVCLGHPGSGARVTANTVLRQWGLKLSDLRLADVEFSDLDEHPEVEAAILSIGVGNDLVDNLLASGQFRFVPMEAKQVEGLVGRHPSLSRYVIRPGDYPGLPGVPTAGALTVKMPAFLVVRKNETWLLVETALAALYGSANLRRRFQLMAPEDAAAWRFLPFHPAAHAYFSRLLAEDDEDGERAQRTPRVSFSPGRL